MCRNIPKSIHTKKKCFFLGFGLIPVYLLYQKVNKFVDISIPLTLQGLPAGTLTGKAKLEFTKTDTYKFPTSSAGILKK